MEQKTDKLRNIVFVVISFVVPLFLYYITSSDSLMFDDSGEFALVTKLGSIAHPPGTPAYVFTAMIWQQLAGAMGFDPVVSLTFFSSICVSFCSVLLYFSFRKILQYLQNNESKSINSDSIALFSALAFSTGSLVWNWSNTVEVYSFQMLAMGLTLYGLINFHFNRKNLSLIIASLGIGLGLCNHHLTMIAFLPFVPFFFMKNLFSMKANAVQQKKKVTKEIQPAFIQQYREVLFSKSFFILSGIIFTTCIFFYGWMFIRAQQDFPFMFGKPDTLSRLFYHIRGASYTKNVSDAGVNIVSARIPYFSKLLFYQFLFLSPLLLFGIVRLWKSGYKKLFTIVIVYFLILVTYQLLTTQWANTDAYMLLPYMVLSVGLFFGIYSYFEKWNLAFILPVLLLCNIVFNFSQNNRKNYPVSHDLMHQLDISCPKNSILILGDWTTMNQYYYYRIAQNFRPDLTVLYYDLKFTYFRILPVLYPDFYQKIKPEYDNLVHELGTEHPAQITGTGLLLSTPALMRTFHELLSKIEAIADTNHVPLLTDAKAHLFYLEQHFYSESRYVSGCFLSSMEGDSASASDYLSMKAMTFNSELLYRDPGALDKMEDIHAIVTFHGMYYEVKQDAFHLEEAKNAVIKVIKIQKEMKKNMPFAYLK